MPSDRQSVTRSRAVGYPVRECKHFSIAQALLRVVAQGNVASQHHDRARKWNAVLAVDAQRRAALQFERLAQQARSARAADDRDRVDIVGLQVEFVAELHDRGIDWT